MIHPENKFLIFELMYKYVYEKESIEKVNQTIEKLKKDLETIEAADISALSPDDFSDELHKQWQEFLDYRKSAK